MEPMIRRASVLALLALATSATAADLRDRAPAQGVDPSPDFGTGIQFSAIDGFGLQPGSSSATYFRGFQSGAYYCASGTTDNRAIGQFSVPHGVQITGIRTWIKDNQATSGVMVELQRSCLPDFGPGFPITDTLTTSGTNEAFAGYVWEMRKMPKGSPEVMRVGPSTKPPRLVSQVRAV